MSQNGGKKEQVLGATPQLVCGIKSCVKYVCVCTQEECPRGGGELGGWPREC